ncbi:MAG: type II toxin-antitoxin system RelE/ParE family toxin [Gammaproteobacteria bacterium]
MRILATKSFAKWLKKQKVTITALQEAANEVVHDKYDADLGGHILKKRLGFQGRGKRGGLRTILFYKQNNRLIFLYGFKKNEKANISNTELEAFKVFGKILKNMTDSEVVTAIKLKNFVELK